MASQYLYLHRKSHGDTDWLSVHGRLKTSLLHDTTTRTYIILSQAWIYGVFASHNQSFEKTTGVQTIFFTVNDRLTPIA